MPKFAWSCLSCGRSNDAVHDVCAACDCPAEPTVQDIRERRQAYVRAGGEVRKDFAAVEPPEVSAFDVLVRPVLLLLLGSWPRR